MALRRHTTTFFQLAASLSGQRLRSSALYHVMPGRLEGSTRFLSSAKQDDGENRYNQQDNDSSCFDVDGLRSLETRRRLYEDRWQKNFQEIKKHVDEARKRHPNAPFLPLPPDRFFRNWIDRQRYLYRRKLEGEDVTLSDERLEKFASLGFALDPQEENWEGYYGQLCDFVREKDGLFPEDFEPKSLTEEERKLLWWCRRQKRHYKTYIRGKLREFTSMTPERIAKLNEIDFCWDSKQALWMKRYRELEEYRDHHGDCLVPHEYLPNRALGIWVGVQRTQYTRFKAGRPSTMTPERFALLHKLEGFAWNAPDAKWHRNYMDLAEHVRLNGRGSIPTSKQNSPLRSWVNYQRKQYQLKLEEKRNSLTDERQELLDKLGFPWGK